MGISIRIGALAIGRGGTSVVFTEVVFTDDTETWRVIANNGAAFNYQYTLTALGFNGVQGTDYYEPEEIE